MAFSPDGSRLATLDNNATRLWEARTGKLLLTFPQRGGALAFIWDGTWLFADEGGWINRLDATTGETLQSYTPGA